MRTFIILFLIFSTAHAKEFLTVDNIPKDKLLCVKKKPSIGAGVIATIPYSTRCVEVLSCKEGDSNRTWCKVKHFGKVGWIEANKTSKDKNCSLDSNTTKASIVAIAKSKMGSPYRYGKSGPDSFDCSGFVYYVFKTAKRAVPRTSLQQSLAGKKLKREELQIGDIVVFDTAKRGHVNHSGIYIGEGKFIHATSGKAFRVTTSQLDNGFYKDKFRWGVRVATESNSSKEERNLKR